MSFYDYYCRHLVVSFSACISLWSFVACAFQNSGIYTLLYIYTHIVAFIHMMSPFSEMCTVWAKCARGAPPFWKNKKTSSSRFAHLVELASVLGVGVCAHDCSSQGYKLKGPAKGVHNTKLFFFFFLWGYNFIYTYMCSIPILVNWAFSQLYIQQA